MIAQPLTASRPAAGRATLILAARLATVALTAAAPARRWLAFPFTGVPATPGEALSIFAHNLRLLAAAAGLLLIAQSPLRAGFVPGRASRALRAGGELVLGGVALANIALVGAALGAYGSRMAGALLPHGPVELAAYAFMGALYLRGRDAVLSGRAIATTATTSVALLALAAVLETFVTA
jgi:hypothetical protein